MQDIEETMLAMSNDSETSFVNTQAKQTGRVSSLELGSSSLDKRSRRGQASSHSSSEGQGEARRQGDAQHRSEASTTLNDSPPPAIKDWFSNSQVRCLDRSWDPEGSGALAAPPEPMYSTFKDEESLRYWTRNSGQTMVHGHQQPRERPSLSRNSSRSTSLPPRLRKEKADRRRRSSRSDPNSTQLTHGHPDSPEPQGRSSPRKLSSSSKSTAANIALQGEQEPHGRENTAGSTKDDSARSYPESQEDVPTSKDDDASTTQPQPRPQTGPGGLRRPSEADSASKNLSDEYPEPNESHRDPLLQEDAPPLMNAAAGTMPPLAQAQEESDSNERLREAHPARNQSSSSRASIVAALPPASLYAESLHPNPRCFRDLLAPAVSLQRLMRPANSPRTLVNRQAFVLARGFAAEDDAIFFPPLTAEADMSRTSTSRNIRNTAAPLPRAVLSARASHFIPINSAVQGVI
ncbi:MAG: hypothetical protein M1818_006043 [Claussenomyces sp. TS43310]|nr:MAG: hypothetical protein M1818_006043 [Claussenomyces sp. TS43310]